MDERAHRVGRNEAVFRKVNEQIESLNRAMAAISDETMHIVCECGDLACSEQVSVDISTYERIRADAACFFVRPGHDDASVEHVVERTPGYDVVRKDPGEAQEMAEALDPRRA